MPCPPYDTGTQNPQSDKDWVNQKGQSLEEDINSYASDYITML